MYLDKVKGPDNKPPAKKRRKIDLMAKIITGAEYLKAIEEKETTKKKNNKYASKRKEEEEGGFQPLPDENEQSEGEGV